MRAVKTVIEAAGLNKRQYPEQSESRTWKNDRLQQQAEVACFSCSNQENEESGKALLSKLRSQILLRALRDVNDKPLERWCSVLLAFSASVMSLMLLFISTFKSGSKVPERRSAAV